MCDEISGVRRHYVTYTGVALPLKLVDPLDEAALSNRNTYILAYFDTHERLIACRKMVYGEVELEHRYAYHANGTLRRAEIRTFDDDEEIRVMEFDEQGAPRPV